MTTMPRAAANLPLIEFLRARKRVDELPTPAERRRIRDDAKISRERLGRELGVSGSAVEWWERDDGHDPRPERAEAYRKLLNQIEAETGGKPAQE